MKRESKSSQEEKAPVLTVRLTLDEREQLHAWAADMGQRDGALAVEIITAALKRRARRLKRIEARARKLRKTLPGQIELFGNAGDERREA